MTNSIVAGAFIQKQEIVDRLTVEISDMKKRRQRTVWPFWHYGQQMLQFADTNAQFRLIKNTWAMQGFKFKEVRNYPDMAKLIGATSVKAHIWTNSSRNEYNSESMTESLSILMGYMNAGNEVVTWEINV